MTREKAECKGGGPCVFVGVCIAVCVLVVWLSSGACLDLES